MDFGFINDTHQLYKIKVQQTFPAKLNNKENVTEYFFLIELNSSSFDCMDPPINLKLLEALTLPNYFPPSEILTQGWLAGRHLFEKNWTEVLTVLVMYNWEDSELCLIVNDIKNFLKGKANATNHKKFIQENIPKPVHELLVGSYFRHLWNSIVTQRLETIGLQPLVGDLYCENSGQEVKLVSEPNLKNVSMRNVVMPLPGNSKTRYPVNATVKNLYNASIPKFTTKWFNSRVQQFATSPSYRPVLCNPLELEYSWISKKEFSLRFKLKSTNSCENVLRGLRTCYQLSKNSIFPPQFSNGGLPLGNVSIICSAPQSLPFGHPPNTVMSSTSAQVPSVKIVTENVLKKVSGSKNKNDLPRSKPKQVKEKKTPKKKKDLPFSSKSKSSVHDVSSNNTTELTHAPYEENQILIKMEQKDGQNSKFCEPSMGMLDGTTGSQADGSIIRNKPLQAGTRKRPESQPTSREVEIITISDSSDSEKDEPFNKKKKTFHQPYNNICPPILIANIKKENNTGIHQSSIGESFVNCVPLVKVKLEKENDDYVNIGRVKVEPA